MASLFEAKIDVTRWLKWSGIAASVVAVVLAYLAVAHSATFAVRNVEIEGAKVQRTR